MQIKEERLARVLAVEITELEDRWIDYEDEETEVLAELADLVFDALVTETIEEVLTIKDN